MAADTQTFALPRSVVARDVDRCAVEGCGILYVHVRVAESGFLIGYCAGHYAQANRLFGAKTKDVAA